MNPQHGKTLVEEAASRGFAKLRELTEGKVYQPHAWLPWFIHSIPLDPSSNATRKWAESRCSFSLPSLNLKSHPRAFSCRPDVSNESR